MTNTPHPTNDDSRWRAVQQRDATRDDRFVYAVRTTGVYCKPSCPSRQARRDNVEFFDTMDQAESAGYRPCKRCRPRQQPRGAVLRQQVVDLCRHIEEQETVPTLAELAEMVDLSSSHLHRVFKATTGLTPREYAATIQARRARRALLESDTITDAIYSAGFSSSSRFYEKSDGILGMSPTEFRQKGDGVEIRFAIGECSLGSILVAASDRGICAISLGDEPEPLLRQLQDRFSNATLVGGHPGFEALVATVVGLIEAPDARLDLPLDIRGTAFQQQVWSALREIPIGDTVSYGALARSIGRPRAVRAVASACAANTLAIAIPCHRVVRTDGGLSGYRWGVDRKRILLQREQEHQRRSD